jgi:hypothetical protein
MKLYNLVSAKVGYISPQMWHEALTEAKRDIQKNRAAVQPKEWEFDTWSKEHQLEYISFVMAVYIIMSGRYK